LYAYLGLAGHGGAAANATGQGNNIGFIRFNGMAKQEKRDSAMRVIFFKLLFTILLLRSRKGISSR
jgi:hypothetical protein